MVMPIEPETGARKRQPFRRLSSDKRREEIINAATYLWGHHPEHEVSIDDIAAAAGTSRSSLYRYFESKQELYEVAIQRAGSELTRRMWEVPGGPPSTQLAARLACYFDFIEEYESGFATVLGMGRSPAPAESIAVAQAVRDEIYEIAYRTMEVGEPSPAMVTMIQSWVAGVEWTAWSWLRTRKPDRQHLETMLSSQFAMTLIGMSPFDALIADRVLWLTEVEPPDGIFATMLRSIAGTVDVRLLANVSRLVAYEGDQPG